jgi:D-aminoacyl-tRNA deacylase
MLGVVVSEADRASEHIGEHLRDLADWETHQDTARSGAAGGGTVYRTDAVELRSFPDLHLHLTGVAEAFADAVELLVFASRHSGETGPLLTAHHTGNFGPAEHGGDPNDLARACPNALDAVLAALASHAPDGYEVGMECTHHGPSDVGVPSMFVEVGSAEPQWDDPAAARAVARAILDLRGVAPARDPEPLPAGERTDDDTQPRRHLVGFGDGHYAPRSGRIVQETDWAVGHVASDWALAAMGDVDADSQVVGAAFEQSAAEFAVVDGDHPALRRTIEDLGYRVVSETWVRAIDGVHLGLVDRLESDLAPVSAGLRFGDLAVGADPAVDYAAVSLPAALLDEAQGVDRSATVDVVAANTLAYETADAGSRVTGRAAVTNGDYDELIGSTMGILDRTYDEVHRRGDTVLARVQAFDPEKARSLGVPDGPKFGRLADGDSVRVKGETIEPDQVRSERVDRFTV